MASILQFTLHTEAHYHTGPLNLTFLVCDFRPWMARRQELMMREMQASYLAPGKHSEHNWSRAQQRARLPSGLDDAGGLGD
eukprot:scaffold140177_cov28-Prasinocladus_malaysianus.AAC.1